MEPGADETAAGAVLYRLSLSCCCSRLWTVLAAFGNWFCFMASASSALSRCLRSGEKSDFVKTLS